MNFIESSEDILKVHKCESKRVLMMGKERFLYWCEIYYTLVSFDCEDGRIYGIDVRNETENALGFIGESAKIAEEIFYMVLKNTVTPITLKDVLDDLKSVFSEEK